MAGLELKKHGFNGTDPDHIGVIGPGAPLYPQRQSGPRCLGGLDWTHFMISVYLTEIPSRKGIGPKLDRNGELGYWAEVHTIN